MAILCSITLNLWTTDLIFNKYSKINAVGLTELWNWTAKHTYENNTL